MLDWWTFDEVTGTVADDIVGFDNIGQNLGAHHIVGEVAGALRVADAEYVSASPQLELNLGAGDFTIDAWIRTGFTECGNCDVIPIVEKIDATGVGYFLYLHHGALSMQMTASSGTILCSPFESGVEGVIFDQRWHHVAVTVKRNSVVGGHLYLDGAVVLTFDPTSQSGSLDNEAPLRIGGLPPPNDCSFSGFVLYEWDLDEIEIFNRELSETEIQSIRDALDFGKCKPPLGLSGGHKKGHPKRRPRPLPVP
jgi:hypothetical protein